MKNAPTAAGQIDEVQDDLLGLSNILLCVSAATSASAPPTGDIIDSAVYCVSRLLKSVALRLDEVQLPGAGNGGAA